MPLPKLLKLKCGFIRSVIRRDCRCHDRIADASPEIFLRAFLFILQHLRNIRNKL